MNMVKLLCALALLATGCASVRPVVPEASPAELEGAEALMGTWEGELSAPGMLLHFTLRLPDGRTGTVDVHEQNANGLPLKVVRAKGSEVEMACEVPGAPATLTGTVEGGQLRGTFRQRGHSLPFIAVRKEQAQAPAAAEAPLPLVERAEQARALLGPWHGALSAGPRQIQLDVRFVSREERLVGTLDVREQGVRDSALTDVRFDGKRVSFHNALPNGQPVTFEGVLEGDTLHGTFTQGAARVPFSLSRGERAPVASTRSTDVFTEQDVTFPNGDIQLAGTLMLPRGVARPPVLVLVTGSGPQDRNEEVFGFRVFEALADALAKGGIATLRYDDRGVGQSTGDFHAATTYDFATDAQAAVRFLHTRTDVDTARIGIAGHSEGAVIAPLVATRDAGVAFLVLLAPPAQPLDALLLAQIERIGRAEGLPQEKVREQVQLTQRAVALLKEGKDLASMEAELPKGERAKLESPWFRTFVRYEPRPVLEKVRCPVLALGGSLDLQVPSDLNLPILRQALAQARGARVEEVEGMNHLLQRAKTGAVSEYGTLPREFAPGLTQRIVEWVASLEPGPRA